MFDLSGEWPPTFRGLHHQEKSRKSRLHEARSTLIHSALLRGAGRSLRPPHPASRSCGRHSRGSTGIMAQCPFYRDPISFDMESVLASASPHACTALAFMRTKVTLVSRPGGVDTPFCRRPAPKLRGALRPFWSPLEDETTPLSLQTSAVRLNRLWARILLVQQAANVLVSPY